ncbi:hypothetical protein [Rhizobium sp. LjRoot258]|uniref:hypothetical protein n=1 Tax=Rhizobium sp. LjRoot258 TaxID=3342299 RepID=UPI003ECE5CB0
MGNQNVAVTDEAAAILVKLRDLSTCLGPGGNENGTNPDKADKLSRLNTIAAADLVSRAVWVTGKKDTSDRRASDHCLRKKRWRGRPDCLLLVFSDAV